MRLICQTEREGFQNWQTFAKRLVRGYIDLNDESLGLGVIATELKSVREFAEQLSLGIMTDDPGKMPFHCPNRNHPWFKALMRLKESERRRSNEENPFSIKWMLEVNDHKGEGRAVGRVKIPSRLPSSFLELRNKKDDTYTSAQILIDGQTRYSIEYQQGFTRSAQDILVPLTDPDSVFVVDFEGVAVASGSLDLSRPHLFSSCGRQSNGLLRGEKTNRIKNTEMLVYIPDGWIYEKPEDAKVIRCRVLEFDADVLSLGQSFTGELEISNSDGSRLTFGGTRTVSETQLIFKPLYPDEVLSPLLCDASKLDRCHILTETEDGVLRQTRSIEYKSGGNEWSRNAPYGKIKARGQGVGTDVSEPVSLCNVGSDFNIRTVEAGADVARIKIEWPHGEVTCIENGAVYESEENVWTVDRRELPNPSVVRFRVTVGGDSFMLRLRAPFRQFEVTDELGERVRGRVYVPFCDYDKFAYTINGHDMARARVGAEKFRLSAHGRRLEISAGDELTRCHVRDVYRHGSIAAIFGTMGGMRQMLENQGATIVNSRVQATLHVDDCPRGDVELNIMEFPFRLHYDEAENAFSLTDPEGRERSFRHSLLAFRLGHPTDAPVVIRPEEDGVLRLPEELKSEKDLLVAGKVPGRVLPMLVNKSDTSHTPQQIEAVLIEELLESKVGDDVWKDALDWFDATSEYGLHYSSLLQLKAIGRNRDALVPFLFQCVLRYGADDRDMLLDRLIQFSRDLNFKWFWMIPAIRDGIFIRLQPWIDIEAERCVRMIVPSALSTFPMEVLQPMAATLIMQRIDEFDHFLETLVKRSLEDTLRPVDSDMLEAAVGWIRNDGKYKGRKLENEYDWWPDFGMGAVPFQTELRRFMETGKPNNENWMLCRAKAFASHMENDRDTDLFSMEDDTRRSICLCYNMEPDIFIREAHNEMRNMRRNGKNK